MRFAARFGAEFTVTPIIADGYGQRHFSHIEKMTGVIPVGKVAYNVHVMLDFFQIKPPACHPVGVGGQKDPQ